MVKVNTNFEVKQKEEELGKAKDSLIIFAVNIPGLRTITIR